MKQRKWIFIILCALPFLVFLSSGEEGHSSSSTDFISKVINFAILFGGLYIVLRRPLKTFLEERSHIVDRTMKDAVESRKDAERKLQKAKTRMDSLEKEIRKIHEAAEFRGREEKEMILKDAEKKIQRLKKFSAQEIESLFQAKVHDLKKYAAELAVVQAEKLIQEKMTQERHSFFISQSIGKFETLYEKSDSH